MPECPGLQETAPCTSTKQTIVIRQGYDSLATIWSGSFEEFIKADVSEETLDKESI